MLGKPELLDDVIADEDAADLRDKVGEEEGEWELGIAWDLGKQTTPKPEQYLNKHLGSQLWNRAANSPLGLGWIWRDLWRKGSQIICFMKISVV